VSERLEDLTAIAVDAALEGGRVILAGSERRGGSTKGRPGDYVTEVDLASERAIAAFLGAATPDIRVLGEEEGGALSGRSWVVDPLDGTTNFMHGFVAVGVSVALVEDGRPLVGTVHGPFLGHVYAGFAGGGAWSIDPDGRRHGLKVSSRSPDEAVVGTGFPFRRKDRLAEYLPMFSACLERFEDLRRPGAAALDLAWCAAGIFDGFFELGLGPWDVAAGALLIQEAGGAVTDWKGDPEAWLGSGDILAGPPKIHGALLDLASRNAR
jgi:myo-inositol-1(or 4)-monophosphatase